MKVFIFNLSTISVKFHTTKNTNGHSASALCIEFAGVCGSQPRPQTTGRVISAAETLQVPFKEEGGSLRVSPQVNLLNISPDGPALLLPTIHRNSALCCVQKNTSLG